MSPRCRTHSGFVQKRRRPLLLFVAAWAAWSPPAFGEAQRARHPSRPTFPFARFVPATCELFFSINDLRALDEALRRSRVWQLLPLLSGSAPKGGVLLDPRSALSLLVERNDNIKVQDFMDAPVGLVARSWSELDKAVWFAHLGPNGQKLDRWFPGAFPTAARRDRDAPLFRTRTPSCAATRPGRWVA